jgi:glycosyltransferase involved in cell wall biosynthesis
MLNPIDNRPKVSVCVVTYNHDKYIEKCIQSVVDQQTFYDYELIVCDDCSTDGTWQIIEGMAEKYPNKIRAYRHSRNIGARNNYVYTHKMAANEYIAHLDGDDYWKPGKLEGQIQFLIENSDCSAVYTNATVIFRNDEVAGVFNKNVSKVFDENYLIEMGNFLCHSSMMYRSKCNWSFLEIENDFIDYHIHIKLSELGRLGYIDAEHVAYRSDSTVSVIKANNFHIRCLYLRAINDVNRKMVKLVALRRAYVFFLANALYYELRYGGIDGVKFWLKNIDPIDWLSDIRIKLTSVICVFLIIFNKFNKKIFSKHQHVFYARSFD